MIDDTIVADGCWLFYYTFDCDTSDVNFVNTVCNYTTVSNLVRLLEAPDIIVQYTALKAISNLLTIDSEIVIDRALFENVIDKLLALAEEQPRDTNFITEICFSFSNIVLGTEEQIKEFYENPRALDYTLAQFIRNSIDLRQKREASFVIYNLVMKSPDQMLWRYVIERGEAKLIEFFEAIVDILTNL